MFKYIYSLLIEKDICDRRKVLIKLSCVYVCLSSGDIFIFSLSFLFLFPIFVLSVLRYFPFHVVTCKNYVEWVLFCQWISRAVISPYWLNYSCVWVLWSYGTQSCIIFLLTCNQNKFPCWFNSLEAFYYFLHPQFLSAFFGYTHSALSLSIDLGNRTSFQFDPLQPKSRKYWIYQYHPSLLNVILFSLWTIAFMIYRDGISLKWTSDCTVG